MASVSDSSVKLIRLPDNLSKAEVNTVQNLLDFICGLSELRGAVMSILDGIPQVDESTIAQLLSFTRRSEITPLSVADQAALTEDT